MHDGGVLRAVATAAVDLAYARDHIAVPVARNGEGTAFFDIDNDGDLDLYINQFGDNELWRNNADDNNYLMVRALRDR